MPFLNREESNRKFMDIYINGPRPSEKGGTLRFSAPVNEGSRSLNGANRRFEGKWW